MEMDIDKIKVPSDRMRKIDKNQVEIMALSMRQHGMLNSIIVNAGVLVAGAHRLAAAKLLGWDTINVNFQGNVQNQATLSLIELDENFVRSDLSAAERLQHAKRRVELVSELKLPAKIKEVGKRKVETGKIGKKSAQQLEEIADFRPDIDEDCQNMADLNQTQLAAIRGAKEKAKSEAVEETAEIMGTAETHVYQAVRDGEFLDDAGLDQEDLNSLNASQVKEVVKAAKKGKEAAQEELEEQATKPKGAAANGHNKRSFLASKISLFQATVGALTEPKFLAQLDLSDHDSECLSTAYEAMDMVIKIVKAEKDKT